MIWRNPEKELPKSGEIVAVLIQHWKKHKPLSCQIHFGEVERNDHGDVVVFNNDYFGWGLVRVHLQTTLKATDVAIAWAYASEFPLPEWVPHDQRSG